MKPKPVPNQHFDTDMVPILEAAIAHARAQRRGAPSEGHNDRREAVLVAREKRHLRLINGGA